VNYIFSAGQLKNGEINSRYLDITGICIEYAAPDNETYTKYGGCLRSGILPEDSPPL
jgi:hypothetical protein